MADGGRSAAEEAEEQLDRTGPIEPRAESSAGRLLSVNIGSLRKIVLDGRPTETGIYKQPVAGRVRIAGDRVEGDRQGNPMPTAAMTRAVYAYSDADYRWWSGRLGRELAPGAFGENLTLEGVDASGAIVGERWRVGTAMLEVSEPRQPCSKLGHKMGDPRFPKAFLRELRLGAYLRIVEGGEVRAGDAVEVVDRPDHDVSVRAMGEMVLGDRSRAAEIAAAPQISEAWREWAASRVRP